MQPSTIVALTLLVASTTATAQVHRCTGPDGKVSYSQTACPAGGTVLDNRKPPTPEEQARQPLTQLREVERARRSAEQPTVHRAAPAETPKPSCPDDQEIRNLETAASSVTVSKAERERRVAMWRAGEACRAKGTAYGDELNAILGQSDRQRRAAADERSTAAEKGASARASAAADDAARRGQPVRDSIQSCNLGICRGASGGDYRPAPGVPNTFDSADGRRCTVIVQGMNMIECR